MFSLPLLYPILKQVANPPNSTNSMAASISEPPFTEPAAPIVNGEWRECPHSSAVGGQEANQNSPDAIDGSAAIPPDQVGTPPASNHMPYSYDDITPTLYLDGKTLNRVSSAEDYLKQSFNLDRLHLIQKWLWLAGLPLPPRSLHRQKMLGREIVITEQSDLHLTWRESTLFLKPLWKPLLDHGFWKKALCNGDVRIYRSAAGLILSYI